MTRPTVITALMAAGVLAIPATNAFAARDHHSTSRQAVEAPRVPASPFTMQVFGAFYETGFNSDENFVAGEIIDGQEGWSGALRQPTIEATTPSEGDQHVHFARDPFTRQGVSLIATSPDLMLGPAPDNILSLLSVDVRVTALGGGDYSVVGQSPGQGLIGCHVIFDFRGNVVVLDDVDDNGKLAFVDTDTDFPVGSYFRLNVDLDNEADTIDYRIDGDLIYSSVGGVIGATSFDQVLLMSDNFSIVDTADFDDLEFASNADPPQCQLAPDGDVDFNGCTDFTDLLTVLAGWGECDSRECAGDTDCNGEVEFVDLLTVLSFWDPCDP